MLVSFLSHESVLHLDSNGARQIDDDQREYKQKIAE